MVPTKNDGRRLESLRSEATRFLPNVEFAASWWCVASTEEIWRNPWKLAPRAMPRSVYSRWVEGGWGPKGAQIGCVGSGVNLS